MFCGGEPFDREGEGDGRRVNYGFSPGDDAIPTPYAYVGPHDLTDAAFWNAPFGAYRTWREVTTPEQALSFFRAARVVLGM